MARRVQFVVAAVAVTAMVGGFGACSSFNDERGRGDAPIGEFDDSPAEVLNFPDKFANVAHKCDGHGHRVFSTTRQAAVVVINDSSCEGGTSE